MTPTPNAPHSTQDPPWQLQRTVMEAIRYPERITPWLVNNETAVHHQARAVLIALNLQPKED